MHKTTGLRSDQTIVLAGVKTVLLYPDQLRRVSYYVTENKRRFVFLTNNFSLPAFTIAQLYKCRWQVELFFKWIKQNLHIKSFYGTSDNAVRSQVWIAISVYVLVAIVKKELGLDRSLGEILQILSLTLFEKIPIFQTLTLENGMMQNPLLLTNWDYSTYSRTIVTRFLFPVRFVKAMAWNAQGFGYDELRAPKSMSNKLHFATSS